MVEINDGLLKIKIDTVDNDLWFIKMSFETKSYAFFRFLYHALNQWKMNNFDFTMPYFCLIYMV